MHWTVEIDCGFRSETTIYAKPLGGDFIQEGADNIDLYTETIDGKNTMHSMARAVIQMVQDHTPISEISSTKIKRCQDRSLSTKKMTKAHISILSIEKTKK
jgi:dTDP-4-dehydrorhamnose reductase